MKRNDKALFKKRQRIKIAGNDEKGWVVGVSPTVRLGWHYQVLMDNKNKYPKVISISESQLVADE